MITLAIDPGNEFSAWVLWDGAKILRAEKTINDVLLDYLRERPIKYDKMVCEMIASYGMPCGKTVFETCLWIGRFLERNIQPSRLVYRKEIVTHICGSARAKDGNVRQALIDRLGPKGNAKNPGPCFGISSDMWSALAVAIYDHDTK
jgi:hypothetical protein